MAPTYKKAIIHKHILKNKVATYHDLKELVGLNRYKKEHYVSQILRDLKRDNIIEKIPFTVKEGKIVFLKGYENKVWNFAIKKKLVPNSTQRFLKDIVKNGAVSTLELKSYADFHDVHFFVQKFVKEAELLKITRVEGFNIFYKTKTNLINFMRANLNRLQELKKEFYEEKTRIGAELETVAEAFYNKLGYNVRKGVWFTNPLSKQKWHCDLLVKKPNGLDFMGMETIIVECKHWARSHSLNGNQILKLMEASKELFPKAKLHFWCLSVSNAIIYNRSFWKNNPNILIFNSTRIKDIIRSYNLEKTIHLSSN